MDEGLRRQYLEAMGIEDWIPRDANNAVTDGEGVGGSNSGVDAISSNAEAVATESMPPWLDEAPPMTEEWAPSMVPDALDTLSPGSDVSGLDWDDLALRVSQCSACGLHTGRKQTVFGVGNQNADLMVIGEAPGAEEDRQGEPFVGRAGQLLNAMLRATGLQREQVYIANILKCRPPANRDPRPEEALKCDPYLQRQVALIKPRVILAAGRVAAQNLLKSQEAVGRMRGRDHRYLGIPVVVTYHPAYLLRSPEQKSKAWLDLQRVMKMLKTTGMVVE